MHKAFPLVVIEFPLAEELPTARDSYVVPASSSSTTTTDTTSGETGTKSGRMVTLTAEDMQKKRNDVKARTTLLATKKMKKNLLKQQYRNFKAEGSETLEQTFNRLQMIVGQLQFMDIEIKQDDLNQKFLTSLALEWLMHTIVWRNRSDFDIMSLDDLYNHLKIDEDDIEEMDIKWNMALLSMRGSKPKEQAPKALMVIDGVGWDWSYMANVEEDHALVVDEVTLTEFALMANTSTESKTGLPECADDTVTDYSRPSPTVESTSGDDQNRNSSVSETVASPITPKPFIKFMKPKDNQSKSKIGKTESPKKPLVKYAEQYRKPIKKPNVRWNQRNWNNLNSHQLGLDFVMKKKACFNYGDFNHLAYDCGKRVKKSFTPKPVVHRPYRPSQRPVRTNMNGARPNKTSFNKQAYSYENRPFHRTSVVRPPYRAPWVPTVNKNLPHVNRKFSLGSRNFPTGNRKFLTASRKFPSSSTKCSTADMEIKGKSIKPLACWFWNPSQNLSNKGPNKNSVSVMFKKYTYIDTQGRLKNKEMNDFCLQKRIKREFSNARTPQQNGFAERRNKTLIEAARTMLADAKLPVTFWAEAVNTAYNLGKFEEKGNEGYFIGYSMSSKAFRVFNKRIGRVEESLHVEFLENKAIEKGSGPNWLFDIDSLTKSMNYVPVDAGTISTNLSGTKDAASQEVKKDVSSLRYIAFPNWTHDALLEFSSSKPQDHCSTEVPKGSGNPNPTTSTSNPPADQIETLTVKTPIPTVSSPVPIAYSIDSQEPSSDARLISKRVANQVETPSLDNILSLTNWFEDIIGVSSNSEESNGVEADISNMETTITASPTPTLRIHKDHPKSQIIGPVDTPIQTRNKSKEVGEHNFIATIYQKTDPTLLQFCLFSCFLSQVESKKISDALQDLSWVEAMQEKLLQFKIQNVWTLVDCPKGVRPIGTKWVLKNKKDERGIVIINKARLVAQGHTQEEGIDYDEVFAHVVRIKAIRLFLAYASFMGLTVYQMDVKSAFLYGTIDEEKEDGIFLSQDKYVGDILKKFRYSDVRSSNTPMDKENPWGKDETREDVDLHLYRSTIGSLMYLTASRPDIMFAICACARHQVTPKECHLHAVKRIFRYLKGHPKLGLWYPKESPFDLVAYSDSDYSGATQDRKLTTGGWVRPIRTKWVLKNKKDERGIVIRNKDRLVAQGHTQEEGIDYDEVFAPVARIEAIRLFLAYASFMGFTVYHMDVKSAFLYGTIDEEVYVMQPPGFQDPKFSAKVYKVEKAIYSNVRSSNTPMDKENPWGKDGTGKDVDLHLYRSIIGSLMYLIASRPDIMFAICACARHQVTPKECHLHAVKRIFRYLKDRKSTIGGCRFLGRRLISWQCKKQTIVATSTTKVEYIAAASCCGQVLWIQNQLLDYGLRMPCEALSREFSTSILRLVVLEKGEHNIDFHPMVDFIEASPLRIKKTKEGTQILATVDGIHKTITESSLRRILKLQDEEGIRFNEFSSNIATALIFLANNRIYNFSKMIFDGLIKNVNNKGEVSNTPTESHHTPSPKALSPSHTTHTSPPLPPVTTTFIPTVTLTETTPIRQYTRRARIAQSSALPTIADEPDSPLRDVSQGEACPIESGFITDQDRAAIAKSSTLPHDLAPRVTSSAAVEGSMQQTIPELTALCTSLQRQLSELTAKFQAQEVEINRLKDRVKLLEDREGVAASRFRDDALIKGRSINEGDIATERISDDLEEMATVLTSMDATTVLASRVVDVPIGNGSILTASTPAEEQVPTGSDVVPTASPVFATAIVEYHQFALEFPIERRIELITDLVKYQDNYAKIYKYQSQQRKPMTKKQKRDYYMTVIMSNLGWKVKDFRGMTFEEVEAKFNSESAKKQKTSEEVLEEAMSSEEAPEEKVKEMMHLVPIEEVYVEALQVKHPTIDWRFTLRDRGATRRLLGWEAAQPVITKDKEIFMPVEKDYPLRKGLALVMISYKLHVENYSQMANDLILKIYKIANSPRQQGD
nr:hypothetical protein [Tanacetum cinerariifolium]